jgi:hypothetical protein
MTGMVKEEILTRQVELGYTIQDGNLSFDFLLLNRKEIPDTSTPFRFWGVDGQPGTIELPPGSIAYSICQVPIILQSSTEARISVHFSEGSTQRIDGLRLDSINSRHIFQRDGTIHHLVVSVPPEGQLFTVADLG